MFLFQSIAQNTDIPIGPTRNKFAAFRNYRYQTNDSEAAEYIRLLDGFGKDFWEWEIEAVAAKLQESTPDPNQPEQLGSALAPETPKKRRGRPPKGPTIIAGARTVDQTMEESRR